MSDKKQLNDEELEKVTGGCASDRGLPADHGRHVGKYDAGNYIGQKFYIVHDDDPDYYCWGTLLDSFEKNFVFWTERTHKIRVEGQSDSVHETRAGHDVAFNGDYYTLFLMH